MNHRPLTSIFRFWNFRPLAGGVESVAPVPEDRDPRKRIKKVRLARKMLLEQNAAVRAHENSSTTLSTEVGKKWVDVKPGGIPTKSKAT